ncbi:MAG: hypothetical protein U1F00_18295 [Rhodoferax sp.]
MQAIFNGLFKLVLLAAGLVFAASLLFVALLFLLLWALRALWARLTGQPVAAFVLRVNPRDGFGRVFRPGPGDVREPPSPGPGGRLRGPAQDVEDVEVKPPRE